MLSAATGLEMDADEAMQLFSTRAALFVENQGQWADEAVRYGFQGDGVNIAFTDDGLAFLLSQTKVAGSPSHFDRAPDADGSNVTSEHAFQTSGSLGDTITHTTQFTVKFDGANDSTPVGLAQSESRFNYFVGDVANHRSNVPGYATVAYENLYAGIDLHTFGRRDSLKYEFYVAPGADYRQISVSYDGIDGLWIDDHGALHVETELGQLVDDAPYIYQMVDGQEMEVAGQFALVDDDTYTFEITGVYDPNLELVVDPDLAWSTYLGGSGEDSGDGIAVDGSGNVLVTGYTKSSGWVSGGWDTSYDGGNWDAFVAKITLADLLPGDFNSDGSVDGDDIGLWQTGFGTTTDANLSDGDADSDGDVDGFDFLAWQRGFSPAPLVTVVFVAIEPAFVSSLGSQTAALTAQPLSAELVDAAIAMDLSLQLKPGSRLGSHATLQDDHFDWVSRKAKWGQHPAGQGTDEIADHSFRSQTNLGNDGRFYRDTDADGVDVELLDKLFAEDGLVELL